jgi:hypothetical protein
VCGARLLGWADAVSAISGGDGGGPAR